MTGPVDAKVTQGPQEPCDRPAPGEGDEVSHKHDDGRVCAWNDQEGSWWTVAATVKSEFEISTQTSQDPFPPEPVVDQKQRGAYPKFAVRRADGRDMPGGDHEGAPAAYLVLDPIYDPAARPAYALYARMVRMLGYVAFADDLEANLATLNSMASDAMESPEFNGGSTARSLRVVSTWTYSADRAGYEPVMEDVPTAHQMALFDQSMFDDGEVTIEDMLSLRNDGTAPEVIVMPNA